MARLSSTIIAGLHRAGLLALSSLTYAIGLCTITQAQTMAKAQPEICGETFPCEQPSTLGPITHITVHRAWARNDIDPTTAPNARSPLQNGACRRFYVTPRLVRYYFERAGRITENGQHHNTDESPCFGHGTLRLNNGQTVQWYIGELREAQLRGLPEGTLYFYCERCQKRPFVW